MEELAHIRCLVLEDEVLGQDIIVDYISRVERLQLIAVANNGYEALNLIEKEQLDLLFLDIQVPNLNGIELLKRLSNPPKVIFTTAFPEFAAEGFDLDAIDYLVKPFSFERFEKAINKLFKIESVEIKSQPISDFKEAFIYIKTGGSLVKVLLNEILFIESQRNILVVHLKDRNLSTYGTINEFEERVPRGRFLRIHKSFIVAIDKVAAFNASSVSLQGKDYSIGRNYKDDALNALKAYFSL